MSSAVQLTDRYLRPAPASDAPTRWARALGAALVALWLAVALLAWAGGTREVSLQRFQDDLAFGEVTAVEVTDRVADSRWLGPHETRTGGDPTEGGTILYQRGEWTDRTYAVVPPPHDSSDTPLPNVTTAWSDWGGQAADLRSIVDETAAKSPGLDRRHLSLVAFATFLGPATAVITMFFRRPRSGTFWFWLWLVLGVPAGLGWLAYAWVEHLRPGAGRRTAARRTGWEGVAWSIVGQVGLLLLGVGVAHLFGISVAPL